MFPSDLLPGGVRFLVGTRDLDPELKFRDKLRENLMAGAGKAVDVL